MKSKFLVAVVAAFAFSPSLAAAVDIDPGGLVPGSSQDVSAGPFFFDASFRDPDAAGFFDFTFTNNSFGVAAVTVAEGTVLQQTLSFLGGVTFEWLTAGTSVFIPQGGTDGFADLSAFIPAGGSDTLRLTFGDPTANVRNGVGDIDFSLLVNPIPVPASLPLLLAALAGLGYVARRRKPA